MLSIAGDFRTRLEDDESPPYFPGPRLIPGAITGAEWGREERTAQLHHVIMRLCQSVEQVFRVIRGMTFLPRLRTPCEEFNAQRADVPNAARTIVQALSKSVQTSDFRAEVELEAVSGFPQLYRLWISSLAITFTLIVVSMAGFEAYFCVPLYL